MSAYLIGSMSDFSAEFPRVLQIGAWEIGVFCLEDGIYAWRNICPHQGGPVCQGRIFRRVIDNLDDAGEAQGRRYHARDVNIVCPWHGAEFDIRTGHHAGTDRLRLIPVRSELRDGQIYLHVDGTDE